MWWWWWSLGASVCLINTELFLSVWTPFICLKSNVNSFGRALVVVLGMPCMSYRKNDSYHSVSQSNGIMARVWGGKTNFAPNKMINVSADASHTMARPQCARCPSNWVLPICFAPSLIGVACPDFCWDSRVWWGVGATWPSKWTNKIRDMSSPLSLCIVVFSSWHFFNTTSLLISW